MSESTYESQDAWETGEESETDTDRRRSARKRKKVCYSDVTRRSKKQKEMLPKKTANEGDCPRGNELFRSPAQRGNHIPVVEDREADDLDTTPTADQPVGQAAAPQTHTLDSLAAMIGTVICQGIRMDERFKGVEEKIQAHSTQINSLQNRLAESERSVGRRLEVTIDEKLTEVNKRLTTLESTPRPTSSKKSREEDAYWMARRSLRISPVNGQDLKDGVLQFLQEHLGIDSEHVKALPSTAFRRAPSARNSAIKTRWWSPLRPHKTGT